MRITDLTVAEYTSEGRIVGWLFYGGILRSLLKREKGEYDGYPNNGGSHTLRLRLEAPDLEAFFEIVESVFPDERFKEGFAALRRRAGI